MPKASPIQTSFSGGEFSPLVQGRVDVERFKTGLEICLNYFPSLQGPLVRRPGTKYVADVKDPSKPPALIPFQFSAEQSYMLEFGHNYIRFNADEGQIITSSNVFKVSGITGLNGSAFSLLSFNALRPDFYSRPNETISASSVVAAGSILELVSPFTYPEVNNLKYAQNGDTLFIVGSSYTPYKLQRYGNNAWDLKPIIFQDGPFLPLNSYKTTGDSTRITLVPSAIGLPTVFTGPSYQIWGAANNGQGEIRITVNTSHIFVTGDKVAVRGVPGAVQANNGTSSPQAAYWPVDAIGATTFDLKGSTFGAAITGSSGVVSPALFEMVSANPTVWADASPNKLRSIAFVQSGIRYWGMITSVQNAATATALMNQNLAVAAETPTWQLGVWNAATGYPSAVCFHQDRLVLAGSPFYPQQIDASMSSNYEKFAAAGSSFQVADNNALSFRLLSAESNTIRWVKSSAQGLLAGSGSAEWQVTPNNQAAALTPTNINAQATSFFGSANVDAVQASNATLYVQGAYRKVRELNFFFQVGTFRSTDVAELSEHITIPGINKLAVQKEPFPLVWAVRNDGVLLSMSYNRDDQTIKAGWARHVLGGQSDSGGSIAQVKSIGVVAASSATFDQLWITSKRFINGTSVVGIEILTTPFNDSFPQEDSYCLDYGATYDSPLAVTNITVGGSAVVSVASHGINNGSSVIFTDVMGLNRSVTDQNGNVTSSNFVNGNTFLVASSTANSFYLTDFQGNFISASSYSAYISGGRARRLVTTISGLTWLKGETVGIVADGGIHPDVVIDSSGLLALSYPSAKVQIGYRYNSDGAQLRSDAGAADGSSVGKIRRITRAAFLLHQIGDFSFGPDFTRLLPYEFSQADVQQADIRTPLFSGIIRDSIEGDYSFDDGLCFRQNSGLPGMVQSITTMMDEFDV